MSNTAVKFEIIEKDDYSIFKSKFSNSEFIPSTAISVVMNHYFVNDYVVLHCFNQNHILCKIKIKKMLDTPITNWTYNRPPDLVRCKDISLYMYNSKACVDTMFHLYFNNLKSHFEILDGIHRFTALQILQKENSKPLDLINGCDLGSGNDANWLFETHIIVNIRFNAPEGELIETFKNLNKCQAIPDLYIRDFEKERRQIIEGIANDWQIRYKKHFSSSDKPITGHINRNKFVELLDYLYTKHNIEQNGDEYFKKLLEEANQKVSNNIPKKISGDMRIKCNESGCHLFLLKFEELQKII